MQIFAERVCCVSDWVLLRQWVRVISPSMSHAGSAGANQRRRESLWIVGEHESLRNDDFGDRVAFDLKDGLLRRL